MKRKTPVIQYSKLRYIRTPYKVNGRPKVWNIPKVSAWHDVKNRILRFSRFVHISLAKYKGLLYIGLKKHLPGIGKKVGSVYKRFNARLKKPITLKEAIIIAIIVWVFWPSQHRAIGEGAPPPIHPTKISMLKPIEAPGLAEQQPVDEIYVPPPTPAPAAPAAAAAVVPGCGDNSYAQYIYQHESGCNLNAVNAGGCRGIGQACPGSKLPCGADYACQNAFFTAYANSAYGGWAGAYAFWVAHSWW